MKLESPQYSIPNLRLIISDFSLTHATNALIAFIFAASAPVAIILGVGAKGGLSEGEIISWVFAAFVVNGIVGIFMSIIYRQPLVFFWTISGSVLVGPALEHLRFSEIVGAFIGTGILLLFLGLSGLLKKIMTLLPMPIVMAMVAAVFLEFCLDWMKSLGTTPAIALPMTMAFLVFSLNKFLSTRFPPMLAVLVVGILAVQITDGFGDSYLNNFVIATPQIQIPVFSWPAIFELVIPLAVTVLAAQNAQGIVILRSNGHNPPVNTITTICGAASLVTAIFGCVSTCLTGPVNAIISGSGRKVEQYTAAITICILAIVFGIYSPLFIKLMLATPPAFISTLAGLALLRVLQGSFIVSFSEKFSLGALVCFLVTIVDHPILNIGAPFWGLVFGLLTSFLLERKDFTMGD